MLLNKNGLDIEVVPAHYCEYFAIIEERNELTGNPIYKMRHIRDDGTIKYGTKYGSEIIDLSEEVAAIKRKNKKEEQDND